MSKTLSRRKFMAMMAAGAVVTAEGLWMPGQKLISIPSGKVFGSESGMFRLIDRTTVEYIGNPDRVVGVRQFYSWLKTNAAHMLGPGTDPDRLMVSLDSEFRMANPEHLTNGTLSQDAPDNHCVHGLREMWQCNQSLSDTDLITDKIYYSSDSEPKLRIRELDNGYRGYR